MKFHLLAVDQISVPCHPIHAKDGIKLTHRQNYKASQLHLSQDDKIDTLLTHSRGGVALTRVDTTKSYPRSSIDTLILSTNALARKCVYCRNQVIVQQKLNR